MVSLVELTLKLRKDLPGAKSPLPTARLTVGPGRKACQDEGLDTAFRHALLW